MIVRRCLLASTAALTQFTICTAQDELQSIEGHGCDQLANDFVERRQGNGIFWKCADGSCIFDQYRCDGVRHCFDGSDELECPRLPQFEPQVRGCEDGNVHDCATLDQIGYHFGFGGHAGGDKNFAVHDFLNTYETVLNLKSSARMLEFGVNYGHSAAMWGQWFSRGKVVAVDISLAHVEIYWDSLVRRGANASQNVFILELNATDYASSRQPILDILALPGSVTAAKSTSGESHDRQIQSDDEMFDLIIDDADHTSDSQIARFEAYFPTFLAPGGFYIIEDIPETKQDTKSLEYFLKLARQSYLEHGPHIGTEFDEQSGRSVREYRYISDDWKDQIHSVMFRRELVIVRKAWQFDGLPPQERGYDRICARKCERSY